MTLKKRERQQRDPNAVVLYVRVSTTDQAESGLSIPAQQRALEAYCAERGHVIEKTYKELGASAKDDQRPVFKCMIADVLAPTSRVGTVLVYHSSRFMRNVLQAQAYKAKLKKHGVRVVSSQHVVSDDPQGRMAEQVFEAMDQYESEVNAARTTAAMAENARQGYFNGARAPFGFAVEKVATPSGAQKNKLVPNAVEADVLREVFRIYVAGAGAKATARELNQRGVRYRGRGLWSSDLVLKVLQEDAAIGTYYWGRRDHGVYRDKSEWIPSKVTPLIDDALFELARRVREERDPERSPGRASSSPLLLAKMLRCGRCGAACGLETSGKLDANGEHTYRYYNCRAFMRVGKESCSGCRVPVALLDDAVVRHIGEQVFAPDRCREFLRAFVEETGVLRTKTAEQRRQLEREVADIDGRIARWQEAFEANAEGFDVIGPRIRELKAKRDEVAAILGKLVPLRQVPPHLYVDSTIRKFQATMQDVLASKTSGIAKNYLRMLVATITVTPGTDGVAIEIAAQATAAVAMIAAGSGKSGLNQPDRVLATVGQWRPRHESNVRPTV